MKETRLTDYHKFVQPILVVNSNLDTILHRFRYRPTAA